MWCQRAQAGPQPRLTDQTLVAVTIAHQSARRGSPTVADTLVGLAAEPEGRAGRLLRTSESAAATLAGRAMTASPRLPSQEVALRWAAGAVQSRPVDTVDLLNAALEVGGTDLAEFLETCGYHPPALADRPLDSLTVAEATDTEALTETFGYDPAVTDATPAAARAVARCRAVGGGALTLLGALAVEALTHPEDVPVDGDWLLRRLYDLRMPRSGGPVAGASPGERDRGLEPVERAARSLVGPDRPLGAADLLHAAAIVGGEGPAAVLMSESETGQSP